MGDHSRRFIKQSRSLIRASRLLIEKARRRILPKLRGGSTSLSEPEVRAEHLHSGAIAAAPPADAPRIYAGISKGTTRCAACGVLIPNRRPEYEVVLTGRSLVFDRAGFAAWQTKQMQK
jgi:hypothetical protein